MNIHIKNNMHKLIARLFFDEVLHFLRKSLISVLHFGPLYQKSAHSVKSQGRTQVVLPIYILKIYNHCECTSTSHIATNNNRCECMK